ncbi:kinesin-like protein KIF6 [Chanos chanos]|uniref:Kinesin-like protein n=1 Tax=Chanos chanos TaxID=29144 RepID=A0A6J2WCR2_CHACN|nr:kinesin-like protein KIF6 [Chanos chanos]
MVKQSIQIFARVKPTSESTSVYAVEDKEQGCNHLEFVVPKDLAHGFINNKRERYKFRFQKVFDQEAKQEEIFEAIAKPVADNVLAGYNGTIFAYGQTGSGKTFTITGGPERYSDRGIIPRTLSYLFQCFKQDNSMVYTMHISYLEIYNEMGYDLLDPRHMASRLEDLPRVLIMEDTDQHIHLKNLSLEPSANEEQALDLLFQGDTNRVTAETPMNQASTRSHCIFTIHLCAKEPGSATVRRSKLHLVDLAGSERVSKTGVDGHILTEVKYINRSLHYLEQVIISLSEKNRSHIPYRNSMLTSVLRDSLGGNCMTTMIALVSVDKRNIDESISTCRFAQRVALIKNEAVLNEELDPTLLINNLRKEVQCLKMQLGMVTGQQITDQLSQQDMQRLEEQVKIFLENPDSEEIFDVGMDMRKIHYCFSLLKAKVLEMSSMQVKVDTGKLHSSVGGPDEHESRNTAELEKLRGLLSQRDDEISVLVDLLKKEKRKTQQVAAQLTSFLNANAASQLSKQSSALTQSEENVDSEVTKERTQEQWSMYSRSGPELSIGQQEAFEIFQKDHESRLIIEDNKAILKQRFGEAKALGEQVNQARSKINELKKQLEMRRMQIAAQGMMRDEVNSEELDPVEESLRSQIQEEKKNYIATFERLKGMKTEIEHIQLLLKRSKIKLQKDFEDWWTKRVTSLQVTSLSILLNIEPPVKGDQGQSIHLRPLTPSGPPYSSIPLTGDPETDANILAFIQARQNLLNRTGMTRLK